MSKNPVKDFGPIADDYAFFEAHATEADQDARAYLSNLGGACLPEEAVRMLDFGCGTGSFTERVLTLTGWSPGRLHLTLVEPVEAARAKAVERLARFSAGPVMAHAALPSSSTGQFDLVLANHVLYYVPDLGRQLGQLIDALTPQGMFLTAIAGWSNALSDFWRVGFGLLGVEVPYHTSEDVEAILRDQEVVYQKRSVGYELSFPDSEENRWKILRFLLSDHLVRMPQRPLLDLFEQHRREGRIEITTASDHYVIRRDADVSVVSRE